MEFGWCCNSCWNLLAWIESKPSRTHLFNLVVVSRHVHVQNLSINNLRLRNCIKPILYFCFSLHRVCVLLNMGRLFNMISSCAYCDLPVAQLHFVLFMNGKTLCWRALPLSCLSWLTEKRTQREGPVRVHFHWFIIFLYQLLVSWFSTKN